MLPRLYDVPHQSGVQCTGHGNDVVKNEEVGNHVMIFDHYPLLVARIFRQDPSTTEGNRLHEQVERLAFICCCLDRAAKLNVGNVLEEEKIVLTTRPTRRLV